MKIKNWSRNFLWFTLGGLIVGFLSFVSMSEAQKSQFVKLLMRVGEERVLEDGTKVTLSKGDGDLIAVTISKPAPSPTPIMNSFPFAVKNTPARFSSTLKLLGSYEISIPADNQWYDTEILIRPMNQLQIGFVKGTEGNVSIKVGDVSGSFNRAYDDGTYYEYNLVPRLRNNRFDHEFKSPSTLKVRSNDSNVSIRVEVRQLF